MLMRSLLFLLTITTLAQSEEKVVPLPGTKPLTMEGDITSSLVDGVDKFLLREIDKSVAQRARFWKRDLSSPLKYQESLKSNREQLRHILGIKDPMIDFEGLTLISTTEESALIGKGDGYEVYAVRWPVIRNVHGEGLLLKPTKVKPVAAIIAIPDADQTPEQLIGMAPGIPEKSQYARRLVESGCTVVIPALISRERAKRNGRANLTNREYLYRSAYEMGRHLIGYEVQKILAVEKWLSTVHDKGTYTGVIGWGEGGLLGLYATALSSRIDALCISGCFDSRKNVWQEPIDRNVFGLLEQFGGAELASMVASRPLIIEASKAPELTLTGEGGAPARIVTPDLGEVKAEIDRTRQLVKGLEWEGLKLVISDKGKGPFGTEEALQALLDSLRSRAKVAPLGKAPTDLRRFFQPEKRQQRLMKEMDQHTQWVLRESPAIRKQFFSKLDTSSLDNFEKTIEPYREHFAKEIIGQFDYKLKPFNARSRRTYDNEKWTGYEVVLDVYPDVIAYGILLLPEGMKPGEKRPVVVCQHGLEGRPQHVVEGNHRAYHDFAAKLAERGFITFAPQNLYIFKDRFRTLQRKAYPLRKTLFSIIVPQHQQIVNWLKTLPNVDEKRIAFYGLSYGGKTAMRVPPLVKDYCLSICSADFNDWIWKNASTQSNRYSYVWTGEYEIFEFNLGGTFNYSEMAALIAPRPFMVERGHFDGVAPDERVAYEFAKVRHLYQARLGLKDKTEIEWFVGPHTINGKGTFAFLHKHLKHPVPK